MKRAPVVAILALVTTTGLAAAGARALDEQAIRSIPQQIVEGWNRGDGPAVGAVYAADGTLVAGDGTVTRGRDEIGAYHARLFANYLEGTKLIVEVTSVRFLGPDIALMHTAGGILWPGEQKLRPGNDGIQSFVSVKQDGQWRVLLFQNTRVLPRN